MSSYNNYQPQNGSSATNAASASTSTWSSHHPPHHHHHNEEEVSSIRTLLVPVGEDEISLNLDDIFLDSQSIEEVVDVLIRENADAIFWIRVIEEAWRLGKWSLSLDVLEKGIESVRSKDKSSLLGLKANYYLTLARKAPKTLLNSPRGGAPLVHSQDPNHPESKNPNPHAPPMTKEQYWQAAESFIGRAEVFNREDRTIKDVKAALMLARGRLDEASKLFDSILATEPTHLYALMGRARVLFAKRSFRLALRSYQQVLTLSPNFLPDPRIGIGLCCWVMGDRKKARAAWKRSIAVHPNSPSNSATLLLGLAHLNASKDPTFPGGESARTEEYSRGIELVQAAFKKDNTSAAAAGPLATYFLLSGRPGTVKLAERMIQFADSRILVSEGYLHLARSLHSTGDPAALSLYQQSSELYPDQLLALLAEAQFLIESDSWPAVINLYENILRRHPRCVEALCAIASVHAHLAFTDPSAVDSNNERKKAKEAFDQVLRLFASGKEASEGVKDHVVNKYIAKSERVRELARDDKMFIEIARVWEDDSSGGERCLRAYREALRIIEEEEEPVQSQQDGVARSSSLVESKLHNNIGVLEFHRHDPIAAQNSVEQALIKVGQRIAAEADRGFGGGQTSEQDDAVLSVCTFNRGVVLEALGDDESAIDCYQQIISKHPEYIEAKARLTLIALKSAHGPERNRYFETANAYLKEILTTNHTSLEVRALQSYYLYQAGLHRNLKEFARATLGMDPNDAYALTARGMIAFQEARENRDPSKEGQKARQTTFVRSAQYFERALSQHKHSAIAAQGIAIAIAENVLGTGIESTNGNEANGGGSVNAMAKNTRDALTILNKVRESLNDASVYVNIGHCHFHREEWERAIESYETASKRYHNDKDVSILQYLARAWYFKGVKDNSFSDVHIALDKSRLALSLQPKDLSIKYNIALIQQKAVQILFDLPPQRRSVEELEQAIQDAKESQQLFEELTNDPTDPAPFRKELPRQRSLFGRGLINRSTTEQEAQQRYEQTEQAAIDRAKQLREAERAAKEEAERIRLEELKNQAERLAEQRRKMAEEAAQWTLSAAFADSEDDGFAEGGPGEPKTERKKREKKAPGSKKRSKKERRQDGDGSDTAQSSDGASDDDLPRKKSKKVKRSKKGASSNQMELDEDGEEAVTGGNSRRKSGKIFKSSEFVDSDDSDE